MGVAELEQHIEDFISKCGKSPSISTLIAADELVVVKYLPAEHLGVVLARGQLYASERAGFTWGDGVYVAPASFPLTTMMYGEVGVVGTCSAVGLKFFDASDPAGIDLYQQWITHQTALYLELTTTVHASVANRELRNAFRTRFQIDCVCFRPDEHCVNYVDATTDLWLAFTHWDAYRGVGHGFSGVVRALKWCVVVPDAFKPDGRGHKAFLHKTLSATHSFTRGGYSTLATDILQAYAAPAKQVIVCDFS